MRALLCLIAITLSLSLCLRAEEENPLKKAKVGDWIEWTTSSKFGGFAMEGGMKQTVKAKTDADVTLEIANKTPAGDVKQEIKINLNEKYDPRKQDPNAEFKETGKGEETITVGGKSLKTTWTSYETTSNAGGQKMTIKGKAWVSPEVPLGGLVKSENEIVGMGKQSLELKDFGTGK
ncbi:MAG TPA: hypothetical protein VEK08_00780 [Planctomycetota bacterium]|nr:hypothetical protein [Planctomycetota bacterium]